MLAARALRAFFHVSPYDPDTDEGQQDLADVGGMLVNELVHDSRGLLQKPMIVQFLTGGPKVEPYKIDGGEDPAKEPQG